MEFSIKIADINQLRENFYYIIFNDKKFINCYAFLYFSACYISEN